MTFSEYTLENSPIFVRPECPTCSAQMYLARIEQEKPGYDLRTFECPRCQHVERAMVQFEWARRIAARTGVTQCRIVSC